MAKLIIRTEDLTYQGQPVGHQWNIGEFPKPSPPDPRPTEVATERLLWKHSGALAASVGFPYFIADLPMLVTQKEWMDEHSS